ncbi:MAG: hypothetical protein ABI443_09400 [Chthoniobacterales bacterium]
MFTRIVISLLFATMATSWSQVSNPILNPISSEKHKSIVFDGKEYFLTDTGSHAGGEFARFILKGEDTEKYTTKLGTLLCVSAISNDPIETAKFARDELIKNPSLVFQEILINKAAPAAIFFFGFRFSDGDYQLNIWKYEKRMYGIFCDQVMIAAPKSVQTPGAFKSWAYGLKLDMVNKLTNAHWPPSSNQSFIE